MCIESAMKFLFHIKSNLKLWAQLYTPPLFPSHLPNPISHETYIWYRKKFIFQWYNHLGSTVQKLCQWYNHLGSTVQKLWHEEHEEEKL